MTKQYDLYTLSKEKVAPVLYSYVSWILGEAQKRELHTLYFLARDGYILREIALLICREKKIDIECRYLYCSRISLRMPTYHFIGEEAIQYIFTNGYHVTLQIIFERVCLPQKLYVQVLQQANIDEGVDITRELDYLEIELYREKLITSSCFIEHILNYSRNAYADTIAYLQQEELFKQKNIAIVDSGWTGSMQRSLRQLLQSTGCNTPIIGFYFGMFKVPQPEDGEYLCFYFNAKTCRENKILFCNTLFECFLSAPHGMTVGYKNNLEENKVYPSCKDSPEPEQLQRIQIQLAGITRGAKELLSQKSNISLYDCEKILRKLMSTPSASIVQIYGEFLFCDDVSDQYHFTLAEAVQSKKLKSQLITHRLWKWFKHQNQSPLFWDYGVVALIKNPIKKKWYWLNIYLWKELTYFLKHE